MARKLIPTRLRAFFATPSYTRPAAGTLPRPDSTIEVLHLDAIALAEKACLLLFVAIFILWEARRPARPRRERIVALDFVVIACVGFFSWIAKWLVIPSTSAASAPLADLPLAAKIVTALVAIDFVLYWLHRAMHSPLLWNTHRFHHSVQELDWLKGAYMSGMHIALYLIPQIVIGCYVLGFSRIELAAAIVIGYFVQLWQHANVTAEIGALKYLFVTPQYHRLHHALDANVRDRNFGSVLVVWDYLFGSHASPKQENYALGVADDVPVARGLIGI